MSRYWIRTVVIVILFLVVALLIASLAVSANTFRPALESQLTQSLGRQVTLGNLSFSPFSGSLVADNVAIADDPAFSSGPFLQARSLHIGVEFTPLIFHHKLIITSFTADSPSIHLIRTTAGVWNFSSIGRTAQTASPSKAPAPAQPAPKQAQKQQSAIPNFTVGVLRIRNGSATFSSLPQTGQPRIYSNLNVSAQHVSATKSFPFQISASLPGGGTLAVQGSAGPVNGQDAARTPMNAKVDLNHFDPVAAGVVDPKQGLAMVANVAAQIDSDGQTAALSGTVNASHLRLVPHGAPAPNPVQVRFLVHDNLSTQNGTIDSLHIGTGAVGVSATGSYAAATTPATVNLQVSAPQVPVNQIQQLLPAVGVNLPSGSHLSGGTLTANLKVTGPVDALTIDGPVEIDNTRLAGFNLGAKIDGLKPVRGSETGTAVQTLRANVNSSPSGTQIANLYVSVPALGTATGGGTVSPSGGLNFNILAKLNPGQGIAGEALSGLTNATGGLGSLLSAAASQGIPVTISGTTSDPVIRADVSKLVQRNARGLLQQQLQQRLGKGTKQNTPNPGSILNKLLPH